MGEQIGNFAQAQCANAVIIYRSLYGTIILHLIWKIILSYHYNCKQSEYFLV